MVKGIKTGYVFLWLAVLFPVLLQSQEESRNWELGGYVKHLQTLLFFNDAYPNPANPLQRVDTFLQDNLLHHRLNFRWYINEQFRFSAELRTRVFYGDLVKANPAFAATVDNANNDYLDLSLILLDGNAWVVHSMLDRLYFEYNNQNWEIRLGRQRVNWGISTVWNPNDIFNAFNFTDFDYEERPGSDALRVRYYTGFASSVEIVAGMFDDFDEATVAGLWRFNKWQYDFQLLAGYRERDLVAGGGWAGNISNAGLKGEFTYFHPLDEDREATFAATVGLDYSFANSLYLNMGYLYNQQGSSRGSAGEIFDFELSARNLYPYRHAVFTQLSYPFTPLLNGSLATIYSPVKVRALFLNPSLTYSIKANWDIDLLGQLVFNKNDTYLSPIQAVFLRFKFSY